MSLTIGIIGLPNVGKSTLLNALAQAGAEASNYPFCTIDCNRGVVAVPDRRLESLAEILSPKEVIPSHITYIDIAGLVKGASRGEGLGNKFLHHVREANVLVHVLRCFEDPNVSHVHGSIDPVGDYETVRTELLLSDLDRVNKWISKEKVRARALKKGQRKELDFLETLRERLDGGEITLPESMPEYQEDILRELQLLTSKPELVVLNSGEDSPSGDDGICRDAVERFGEERTLAISARIEREIEDLPPAEQIEFMKEMGIIAGARDLLVEKCHSMLGLIRYYTTANDKLQAWSVPRGTKAPEAAGQIHTDMEKGFIRAKIFSYSDILKCRSEAEIQHQGLLRTEGHDYEIADGDVVRYLFNPQ